MSRSFWVSTSRSLRLDEIGGALSSARRDRDSLFFLTLFHPSLASTLRLATRREPFDNARTFAAVSASHNSSSVAFRLPSRRLSRIEPLKGNLLRDLADPRRAAHSWTNRASGGHAEALAVVRFEKR